MKHAKTKRWVEDQKRTSVCDARQICIDNISYNEEAMMFITPMRKLRPGLLYQEGVRVSRRMVIKFTVAHGVYHTFLNRIQLYRIDGRELKMVVQRFYQNFWWNESDITTELIAMVKDCLKDGGITVEMSADVESDCTKLAAEYVNEAKSMTSALGERYSSGTNCAK